MRTSLLGALLGIWIALPQPAAAEGHGVFGEVVALPGLRITIGGHVWRGDHRDHQVRPPHRDPIWRHRPPTWRAPRHEMHRRPDRPGHQIRRHDTTRRHQIERGHGWSGQVGPRVSHRPAVGPGPRRAFRHGAPAERRAIEPVRRHPGHPRDQH